MIEETVKTIYIPHETLEMIFGPIIADSFDQLWTIVMYCGCAYMILHNLRVHIRRKKRQKSARTVTKTQFNWIIHFRNLNNPQYRKTYEDPRNWRWDEEKQLWVDADYEAKMEKYRKFREGKPPTYEEWKAARQKTADKENSNLYKP